MENFNILVVTFCYFTIVFSKVDETIRETEDINEEQLFTKLFKQRRVEHLQAVKRLVGMERSDNQHRMVTLVAEKVFSTLKGSRAILEGSGYIPGSSAFPQEENVADALANILENTALFGDILLHLPDITAPILHSKNEWEVLYLWSLSFSSQTSLLDKTTNKLIHLVEQELNITERDPDYVNPYRKQRKKHEQQSISEDKLHKSDKKSKKEEKKKKKGPRITLGEL